MKRLLVISFSAFILCSSARADITGYKVVFSGNANMPTVALTNESDTAKIDSFSMTIGHTGYHFDYALVITLGGLDNVATLVRPDTLGNFDRSDFVKYTFTGFDDQETFTFRTDVDRDPSANVGLKYWKILFNNGTWPNSLITVNFSDSMVLSGSLPDFGNGEAHTFSQSEVTSSLQVESLEVLGSDLTNASAIIRGLITDDAGDMNCWGRFRHFKKSDGLMKSIKTEKQTLTTINGTGEFSQFIEGLEPDCTYRFQASGGNSTGNDVGRYVDFTTRRFGPPYVLYVDDNAVLDPGPNDLVVSDPNEDGSSEHPYDSIQQAIDAAHDQMTVRVSEGRYVECLSFKGKSLDVIGFDVNSVEMTSYPIIDANDEGTCVVFDQEEDANSLLSGFVLTRGYDDQAGAIACIGSSPIISNCLVVGNRCFDPNDMSDPNRAIIYCVDSNSLFENCTIVDNYGGSNGAGLFLTDCNVVINNSILWDNMPELIQVASGYDLITLWTTQNTFPDFALPGFWTDVDDSQLLPVEPNDPNAGWLEGDYHLQSQAGRYDPQVSDWVKDEVTSDCIDSGDPRKSVGLETNPHGDRINIGAYGGVWVASRTPTDEPLDGIVFVPINDPGFTAEMSKYETTNAQYCEYLNAALADGLITVHRDRVYAVSDTIHSIAYFDICKRSGDLLRPFRSEIGHWTIIEVTVTSLTHIGNDTAVL